MATDDERREVSERLRELADYCDENEMSLSDDDWPGILSDYIWPEDGGYHIYDEDCRRLADLIEPSCDREAERTCRDTDCDTESITCSECGEITRYTLFWVDVDGGKTVKGHRPRFCSNCGRRVLYDSNDYI